MKLRIASDLHFEFHRDKGATITTELQDGDFDVLVLAGDVADYKNIYEALILLCNAVAPKPVLYVLGNHEVYQGSLDLAISKVEKATAICKNLQFLEDGITKVGDQRFIGCTLWYPHPKSLRSDKGIGDFKFIKGINEWLHVKATNSAKFLESNVREDDVVITHYLPHPSCVAPRFKGDPFNRYFLHDVSGVVERAGAKLWIHGHTHCSVDVMIGKTRIVCNPFGYARMVYGEPNSEYVSDFDVDI
jgi:Icc-related predicted phosphoesterase